MHKPSLIAAVGIAALLTGCQKDNATETHSGMTQSAATPAPDPAVATTTDTPASPAANSASASVDYAAYIGKYPFDKVGDLTIIEQPDVASALRVAVGDPTVVRSLLAIDGPGVPIFKKGDQIGVWQCQQHMCGPHNWTILFNPQTKTAEVCYTDTPNSASNQQRTRWYSGGRVTARTDDCPSE